MFDMDKKPWYEKPPIGDEPCHDRPPFGDKTYTPFEKAEETIREIPAEETLNMLSKIWELAGLLVDERR